MFEMLVMVLDRLSDSGDCLFFVDGTEFDVTMCDFEGFDDEWEEVMRDYEDQEMVDAFFELLDRADRVEGDYYRTYYFEDCSLELGYASYDI